jgi:hypothetical protein
VTRKNFKIFLNFNITFKIFNSEVNEARAMEAEANQLLAELAEIAPNALDADEGVPIENSVALDMEALLNRMHDHVQKYSRIPTVLIVNLRRLCWLVRHWPWWWPKPWWFNLIAKICKLLGYW